MTGLQAARELSRRAPAVRLLMLSMYDNEQYFLEALKAGAAGYVLKSVADQRSQRVRGDHRTGRTPAALFWRLFLQTVWAGRPG